MRRSASILALGGIAAALSVPMNGAATPAEVPVYLDPSRAFTSGKRRESGRGSKRYAPKDGNSKVDNARRERADAKRNRKRARNLADGSRNT